MEISLKYAKFRNFFYFRKKESFKKYFLSKIGIIFHMKCEVDGYLRRNLRSHMSIQESYKKHKHHEFTFPQFK